MHAIASKTLIPNQLLVTLPASLLVSLNGELFVSSAFGACEVLLGFATLELVCAAATLVVVKLVLSAGAVELMEEEGSEVSPDTVVVSVNVDFCVVVLPRESVVVYVLTAPG